MRRPDLRLGSWAQRQAVIQSAVNAKASGTIEVSKEQGAVLRIVTPQARDRWRSAAVANYTTDRIENVLRGAFSGDLTAQWELFDLMEDTWPRLPKNLNALKRAVIERDWVIQPWTARGKKPTPSATKKAEEIEDIVWNMRPEPDTDENDFEDTIYDVLDAWGKGTSVLEMDFTPPTDGVVSLRCTRWIHPRYYGYPSDQDRLMLNASESGVQLPPGETPDHQSFVRFPKNKFIIAKAKHKTGHPIGAALLRPLAWWWCAANFGAEWLLNHAQLFGQPLRWVNYDPSRSDLLNDICDMLENMGSAGWAAFPTGTTMELREAAKAGNSNPQAYILELADKTCDLLVLGQTLTSDVGSNGGNRALGDVHMVVREDIIQAAAEWAAKTIGQLVRALCILNYGNDDECPWFSPSRKQVKDAKAMAERDEILLRAGMTFQETWFHERHDVPVPAKGERVIGGRPTAPEPGETELLGDDEKIPANAKAVRAKAAAQQKLIDNVLEDATGVEAKWLASVRPFFASLVEAAQSPQITDEEFERLLVRAENQIAGLFPALDVNALQGAMEKAMGSAAVNGAVKGFLQRKKARGK